MSDLTAPPSKPDPSGPPPAAAVAPPTTPEAPAKRRGWVILKRLLLIALLLVLAGSLMTNVSLMALLGMAGGGMEQTVLRSGSSRQVIAMYEVSGGIGDQQAREIGAFIRAVRKDKNVKAVLLRVDSPGGGVSACDRIYNAVKELKEEHNKPVYVSMGGVAASGGYYISTPADLIFAEPTTITGSIGVIGQLMTVKGTLDKIGLEIKVLPSTQARGWKAGPNPFEEPAPYQIAEVQQIIDDMHQRFEDIVAAERKGKLTTTTAEKQYTRDGTKFTVKETEPFNGRVFMTKRALELGLIDQEGFLDDAIAAAAKAQKLDEPKVVIYRRRRSFTEGFGIEGGGIEINADLIDQVQTPRILMMWKVGQ